MAMFGVGCPKCWEKECNCHLLDDIHELKKELFDLGFAAKVALDNFHDTELVKSTLRVIAKQIEI